MHVYQVQRDYTMRKENMISTFIIAMSKFDLLRSDLLYVFMQ